MFTNFSKLQDAIINTGIDDFTKALLEKVNRGILEANEENTILSEYGIYYLERGRLVKVLAHITDYNLQYLGSNQKAKIDYQRGNYNSHPFVSELHKYHFTKCTTLKSMFESNKGAKYFMSQKTDGTFSYSLIEYNKVIHKSSNQKLYACRYCLSTLQNMTGKKYSPDVFKPDIVFNEKVSKLSASEFNLDCDSVPNIYARDWADISKHAKQQVGWTCEKCNAKPERKNLHCHHIDSNKANNKSSNLMVLCRSCHEDEHPHMKQ